MRWVSEICNLYIIFSLLSQMVPLILSYTILKSDSSASTVTMETSVIKRHLHFSSWRVIAAVTQGVYIYTSCLHIHIYTQVDIFLRFIYVGIHVIWSAKSSLKSSISKQSTVKCRYNAVQYYKLLNLYLQKLRQNINQMLDPQKDTPYLALTGELWGVICEYLWENWQHYGTALYCVWLRK